MVSLSDDVLKKKDNQAQEAYLSSLYEEAKTCLDLNETTGADEIMPALVQYFQDKYHPENLDLVTLQTIFKNLYAWQIQNTCGLDAYIQISVHGAMLCMINESINKKLITDLDTICTNYLLKLKKEPDNPLTKQRETIVSQAKDLLWDEKKQESERIASFFEKISDNQCLFNKKQYPNAILFLKMVAVLAAFFLGAGIGGIIAYQKLFKHSMFQPSVDNTSASNDEKDNEKIFRLLS